MTIARRAVGTVASAQSGNISPGIPAGTVAGDILVCTVLNGANDSLTFSGSWAKKVEVNNGTNHRVTLAWLRAAGGDSAPTISGATQDIIARIVGYSGCVASGDPFDGTPTTHVDTSATTTVTGDAITPSVANTMLLFAGGQSTTGAEQPTFSGYSGSNPAFSEAVDNVFVGGVVNPAIFLADGTKNDTSTSGSRTATSTQSLVATGVLAALLPFAGTAALTGTATGTIDEADIVAGGKTHITTLTGETWAPASAISDISFIANALGGTTTTTSFSVTLPATQAGDILILEFAHRGTGDGTIGGTSVTTGGLTWTLKHSQLFGSSAFSGKTYWTRATGDHAGQTVTGSSLTDSCAAIVTQYRGALASGDPLADATIVGEQNASGNETQAEISTATDKAWVVLVVVNSPDLAVATQACTSPGALTERAERLSTGGTDTSVSHASAVKATAGATGALTWTQTNAASGSWAYAIKPNTTTPFADSRAAQRAGIVSAQSEGAGFNAQVNTIIPLGNIVRTSDTVRTITFAAAAGYDITAQETVGDDIPGSALAGGNPITSSPTFTIDPVSSGTTVSVPVRSHSYAAQGPKLQARVQPGQATHTYTGIAPQVRTRVQPGAAAHTYIGMAPDLLSQGLFPPAATHSYVGQAPQVRAQVKPAQATHSYTAQAPQVRVQVKPGAATHSYSGQAPQVRAQVKPGAATHVYAAQAPQAKAQVRPGAAVHNYIGIAPGIQAGLGLFAPAATHTYLGRAPQLKTSVLAAVAVHSYTAQAPQAKAQVTPGVAVHSYSAATPKLQASVMPAALTHTYVGRAPQLRSVVQAVAVAHSYLARMPAVITGVMSSAGLENTLLGAARIREITGDKQRTITGGARHRELDG